MAFKQHTKQLNVFEEIYQASYFLLYRKIFNRKKTTAEVINIIEIYMTTYRYSSSLFNIIHAPFVFVVTILLVLQTVKYIFPESTPAFIILIPLIPFLLLYVLSKFNRRYFFNQKRYKVIIPKKWTDFSLPSRIIAHIYILLLVLPVAIIIFLISVNIEQ